MPSEHVVPKQPSCHPVGFFSSSSHSITECLSPINPPLPPPEVSTFVSSHPSSPSPSSSSSCLLSALITPISSSSSPPTYPFPFDSSTLTVPSFAFLVYSATRSIPLGFVSTYFLLHKHIGCRGCPQAVGQALKRNPYPSDVVPCHRVVKTDLSLGGYAGQIEGETFNKKIKLLKKEGVQMTQEQRKQHHNSRGKATKGIMGGGGCSKGAVSVVLYRVAKECVYRFDA
eukprot:GHVS01042511.1.p1 GENE.GHVS01042511.1~~GHVS01042511.1.p1  ORF type:complete len:228 (+),score=62.22 GHVS01042511.1:192-875(+)